MLDTFGTIATALGFASRLKNISDRVPPLRCRGEAASGVIAGA